MVNLQRILCPIDFSACSRHALMHAVALAQWYGGRMTVLHVFERVVLPQVLPLDGGPIPGTSVSRDELVADVARFVDPLKAPGVPLDIVVEEGHVARTIVETAAKLPADVVVIGTHGRGGVEHLMLGSVAEKVLRKARSPVLIVPPAAASAPSTVRFERILCPIDFGDSSVKALEYALSLAQEADAALTLLHVLESLPDESVIPFDLPEYRRVREEDALRRLRDAVPTDARDWCHPVELVAAGKPYREILRVARETKADLIVMGVVGRGAVDLMFFGSTTNHVVRQATCPVLTLRAPAGGSSAAAVFSP